MAAFTSTPHLVALGATAVVAVGACALARRPGQRWGRLIAIGLAVALIGNEVWYVAEQLIGGSFTAEYSLPVYLCDVTAVVAGAALISRRQLLVELTYYWALAGSLQGLLTPDEPLQRYDYTYLEFYLGHGGVIVAALLLVVGMRLRPRPWSAVWAVGLTIAFTAVVGVIDVASGGNYMYLRHVPASGSLLNLLGPWPWYIVSTTGIAIVLLTILSVPFWRRSRAATPATGAMRTPRGDARAER